MSVVTNVLELTHQHAASYVDEHVDQFDAFSMSWNGADAVHLTFGRNTMLVKTSRLEHYDDKPAEIKSGKVEVFRLDVAGISMPLSVAKELAETLTRMIQGVEGKADE